MKIGVISDTHNFFDPRIPALFQGVDHILHGGDIGGAGIVFQLEQIAPVTAITGNTDMFLQFRETEVVELQGRKFLLHHIVGHPGALENPLRSRVAAERPEVIVFGHTHKPFCERINGILYFNPGYAGKSRFGMERSLAVLHPDGKDLRPQFLPL
jgi:putative phosphoesterase